MGDTKEIRLLRGVKIARIIAAALTGFLCMIAFSQILFFQEIKVCFQTGADAQQVNSIIMKKGENVALPTPLKPGSYFLGWSLSPDSADVLQDSTGLVQDTTLYAVWDGDEKYALLTVNGMSFREVNIFDTSLEGLTADELNYGKYGNDSWRVLDDYAQDNENVKQYKNIKKPLDWNNNFTRFKGWQYLNQYNTYNDLLYEQDASGVAGTWTWVQRDADSRVVSETVISETNKFYPPNYRTIFTALLDYRPVIIELYDADGADGITPYDHIQTKMGEENVTFPLFVNNPTAHFSHWEIEEGNLKNKTNVKNNPELVTLLSNVKKRYAAGEKLNCFDPLLYYYGQEFVAARGQSEIQVVIRLRAVYWNDTSVYHYTTQSVRDLDAGAAYKNFGDVDYHTDFGVDNPVAYDEAGNCIWLHYSREILSYAFYDHNGIYHNFTTDRFGGNNLAIPIDVEDQNILGEKVYFKSEWGINVIVNYQSSVVDVTVRFEFGNDLYLLPNYYYYDNTAVTTLISKIGYTFNLLSCERYLKSDHIFTGWQIEGDESGRLYCAGEKFTVPRFDITQNPKPVIKFVAVWHIQRLLFDFDFAGGKWRTEEGPDFTLMKGAFGDRVRIVGEKPYKFGYNFEGWTLEDGTDMLQPNDFILVGTKFQTLHAHWTARRLHVKFYIKNDITGKFKARSDTTKFDVDGNDLYAGGTIELWGASSNNLYTFNGWLIGDQIVNGAEFTLTNEVLEQLETIEQENKYDGPFLEVHIYASQTKRTVNVTYDFNVEVAETGFVDVSHSLDFSRLDTVLTQNERFFDYYPFSEKNSTFDTAGREFVGWAYTTDGGRTWKAIDRNTMVPTNVKNITVQGGLQNPKQFSIQYYYLENGSDEYKSYAGETGLVYGNQFELQNRVVGSEPELITNWGSFVGWSFENDLKSGNPKIIYDVYNYNFTNSELPQLKLLNENDTTCTHEKPYAINVDRYAEWQRRTGNTSYYTLRLYAVYSNSYATFTYNNRNVGADNNYTELQLPIYSNNNYTLSQTGGRTVGSDSADFAERGNAVLDDNGLLVMSNEVFVGWTVRLPAGVSEEVKKQFENRIWFPGEFLPAVDFDLTFEPKYVEQNTARPVLIGNRYYSIYALKNIPSEPIIDNSGYDVIVALPRGTYTVHQGELVIKSLTNNEVHVVVPVRKNQKITLEPRAIQCDSIKEFYVGDNLIITGSPVVGANFQAYRVQKGYRLINNENIPTDVNDASANYDFAASMLGLLVSHDGKTLLGVPSAVNLTANALLNFLKNQGITKIASYALSDINHWDKIDLSKNSNLEIAARAIYNSTSVRKIILPAGAATDNLTISSEALSGALTSLTAVTFGDETTTTSLYAFVDNGFIYYNVVSELSAQRSKNHLMYVLRNVELDNLDYIVNNLTIDENVTIIEQCALMGLDWKRVNSVTANNVAVDLTGLEGLPANEEKVVPLFTSVDNPNKGPRIQPYVKTFRFVYRDLALNYDAKEVNFVYGQTFRVFNAQDNNYGITFNRAWSQFEKWKISNNDYLNIGRVLTVGISPEIIGDMYVMQFDASSAQSWKSYPVKLITFSDENNQAYQPSDYVFSDTTGKTYTIDDLFKYTNDLGSIYLPGLNHNVQIGGDEYQFIGWATKDMPLNTAIPNDWNSVASNARILPNHDANTSLASARRNNGVYTYYALYEKVTPNLTYEFLGDNTSVVKGIANPDIVTNLNIPFATYKDGYMRPVSKINDTAFNVRFGSTLNQIVIGAAVSEIGRNAFNNVQAKQIKFNHKGDIYYNHMQGNLRQLTISDSAFAGNNELTELVLPTTLTTLGDGAFKSCSQLRSVAFENGKSSLLKLGNFVFYDDHAMTTNAIVRLLVDDGKDNNGDDVPDIRFADGNVGYGIFTNTKVESSEVNTNKIVWRGTLLHAYYKVGMETKLVFDESKVAGYAFVNLGNDNDAYQNIKIKFSNPAVQIKVNAFSELHSNIGSIYLNGVRLGNVKDGAFNAITHDVNVYVDSPVDWSAKFNNNHVSFPSSYVQF